MECPACHTPNIDGARFCAKCGALLPAAPETSDPLIGAIVGGRYRITSMLGEGGMGRVYVGEQQMGTSVRKVAVKTLLAEYTKDPEVQPRFMRECGTMSELEHPNTIKVFDFGKTDSGDLYIAMELLNGMELEKALERGALQPERVDHIVGQICGSLQEAHEKGIVHRDLKPANIYLTTRAGEEDYVKVLDFGIAKRDEKITTKQEQKLTKAGTVLGTPPYMSPEQFKGGELDARSDIYSLGVMTYEMLTGRLPFDADTPWAWATQHMTAQPFPFETIPMAGQVPAKMKHAVMRALAKDKTQRQQSVREFFEEFTEGGQRLSTIGAAPRTSFPDSGGQGGTAMMPAARGIGGAQTQMGEPIFTGQQQPAGHTLMDQGSPSNPGYPPAQQGYPSNPAMHAQPPVPTGGGQAYPAPMAASTKQGGGSGVIIGAIIAVLAVVAIIVVVVVLKKPGTTAEDGDAGLIVLPGSGTAVVVSDGPPDAGGAADAGGVDAGVRVVNNVPPTGTTGAKVPGVDPKADAECKAAEGLAAGGNVAPAVNHFRNCDGPGKVAARVAIDQAAQRSAARGCAGLHDAQVASGIGLQTALNNLKAKHCGK
ncbi:MAG: protein kinase [Byssovorax sp.]